MFVTSHHRSGGMDEGRLRGKKEPGGLERRLSKLFDPPEHLLIFISQKPEIWDRAFMLRCSPEWVWHTDEGREDNGVETGGRGLSYDSIDKQHDSSHACCLCLWALWNTVTGVSVLPWEQSWGKWRTMHSGRQSSIEIQRIAEGCSLCVRNWGWGEISFFLPW